MEQELAAASVAYSLGVNTPEPGEVMISTNHYVNGRWVELKMNEFLDSAR